MPFKRIVLGSLLGATALAGAATAQELTVWTLNYSSDRQRAALDNSVTQFQEMNPGVTVNLVKRGTDEHKTALRVASGSDSGPDVWTMWAGLGLGGRYVQAGLSADLTEYYEQYGWEDRLTSPSLGFTESFADGKHGMPYRFSGEAVYYNKKIFEEHGLSEPTTYEELVAIGDTLKEAGIPAWTFGGTVNWHVMRLMDVLLETTCGAETHDQLMNMEISWTETPCAEEAFAEQQRWATEHFLSPFMGIDNSQSTTLWLSGRAAMMLEGDWHVNTIREAGTTDDYGIFAFPTGTGRLYGFAEYLYVSTKTEHPELAAQFLDMFTSDEFQAKNVGAFGALSVNRNVELGDDADPLHKEWLTLFAEAGDTFVNGDQAFPLDVTTEYFRVINEVSTGEMTPAGAAEAMQTFIDARE